MDRYVIITGDDLGMCPDVNAATLAAVRNGLVRSVEIMAPTPAFAEAAAAVLNARDSAVDVGVHLTLTSEFDSYKWGPLLPREQVPSLYDAHGHFPADVETVRVHARMDEVVRELQAQIQGVLDAGLRPSHLTQHMFCLDELSAGGSEAFEVLSQLVSPFPLAVRVTNEHAAAGLRSRGVAVVTQVPKDTHDTPIDARLEYYGRIIRGAKPGITELLVHCAFDTEAMRAFTTFGPRRQRDYDLMIGDELRAVFAETGVRLISWGDVREILGT